MTEKHTEPQDFKRESLKRSLSKFAIDERMVVVTPQAKLAFYVLLACIAAVMVWSVLGSIAIKVTGPGISLTTGGVLSISSEINGKIVEMAVKSGDKLEAGSLIATIYDLEQNVRLETAIRKQQDLKKDLEVARINATKEAELKKQANQRELESSQFALKMREHRIPSLEKDVASKNRLHEEGLLSISMLEESKRSLMEEKIRIEELKSKIKDTIAEIAKEYKPEELKNYERLYRDASREVDELQAKESYFKIYSPTIGTVQELQVHKDSLVKEGQSLVLIELPPNPASSAKYLFYCFFSADEGQKIEPGMRVYLDVSAVDPQKYGSLIGKVVSTSRFPVTEQHILNIVQNEQVIHFLTQNQHAAIEVIVQPEEDPSTFSGYRWTSKKGPPIKFRSGLICLAKVIVEKRKPISYIFPEWWLSQEKNIPKA